MVTDRDSQQGRGTVAPEPDRETASREDRSGETAAARMTCVFEMNVRTFNGNPHHTETPFGKPVIVSDGDLAARVDHLEQMVADAYQIVAALAYYTHVYGHPDIERALDYLNGQQIDGDILPWPREHWEPPK